MARQSRTSSVLVAGPLAPFAGAYREAIEMRGYSPLSAVNLQRQVAWLSRWLDSRGLAVEQLDEACVEAFIADQRAKRRVAELPRPGLSCLLELLRDLGAVGMATPVVLSPTERLMERFGRYLLVERGLVLGTVRGYVDRSRRFVAGLGPGGIAELTAAEVTAAVLSPASCMGPLEGILAS